MQLYEGFVPFKLAYCFSFWGLRPQAPTGALPLTPLGDFRRFAPQPPTAGDATGHSPCEFMHDLYIAEFYI